VGEVVDALLRIRGEGDFVKQINLSPAHCQTGTAATRPIGGAQISCC
jgi:hypothetical protein